LLNYSKGGKNCNSHLSALLKLKRTTRLHQNAELASKKVTLYGRSLSHRSAEKFFHPMGWDDSQKLSSHGTDGTGLFYPTRSPGIDNSLSVNEMSMEWIFQRSCLRFKNIEKITCTVMDSWIEIQFDMLKHTYFELSQTLIITRGD
jgi:hypothetical protein